MRHLAAALCLALALLPTAAHAQAKTWAAAGLTHACDGQPHYLDAVWPGPGTLRVYHVALHVGAISFGARVDNGINVTCPNGDLCAFARRDRYAEPVDKIVDHWPFAVPYDIRPGQGVSVLFHCTSIWRAATWNSPGTGGTPGGSVTNAVFFQGEVIP